MECITPRELDAYIGRTRGPHGRVKSSRRTRRATPRTNQGRK
ncbi:hypothetical protein Pd630_LPD01167 [Rhodococcus opacus PD630]|nr:hypothetical protein Pd630_LPD01167 [Rhodococcus opacus PD630]